MKKTDVQKIEVIKIRMLKAQDKLDEAKKAYDNQADTMRANNTWGIYCEENKLWRDHDSGDACV